MNKLKTLLSYLLLFLLSYTFHISKAEIVKVGLCKKFLEAKELYVFDSGDNQRKLSLSNGETVTFIELVKKTWTDKKVIEISLKEYNKLDDLNNKYFITITTFSSSSNKPFADPASSMIPGIIIKRGKFKLNPSMTLAWMNLNLSEILTNNLPERLVYAVSNLKYMIDHYKDKSERTRYTYKLEGFKDSLAKKTLYIHDDILSDKLKDTSKIKKVYPYQVRIISKDEWIKVILTKKKDALFIEAINSYGSAPLQMTQLDIYSAESGMLLVSTYPWQETFDYYKIKSNFFGKVLY